MLLLRDRRAELEAARVSPFGISRDSPWSHVAWRQALDIDVPLLSDWNGDAVRAFGVARRYRGLEDVAERSAFLVDGERVVRGAWRYETGELPDLDELLAAARSLA
jgi:glutaredoxin-dependent peroxiredoxin